MAGQITLRVTSFSADSLFASMANEWCAPEDVARNPRAQYIAEYLKALNAQTIVVEDDYVDRDFLEDFASYYVRCFKRYSKTCRRLHFFRSTFNEAGIKQAILSKDQSDCSPLQENYLGFIVARPLPSAIVGRTALAAYPDDGGRRYYPCTVECHSNLCGIPLRVRSLPYQEQDTVLAACATVALWSAFSATRALYDSVAPSPAAITRLASEVVHDGRPFPSHGLIVEQVCNAIKKVGLEPEVFRVTASLTLNSLIYAHVHARTPVVLVVEVENVGLHAITIAGYSLLKATFVEECPNAASTPPPMIGRRISELYGHDDQIGPFARIKVLPGRGADPVLYDGSWRDAKTQAFLKLRPLLAIVPLYHKIRVTFVDVQEWLSRLSIVFRALSPQHEWESWLVTTNELKESARRGELPLREELLFGSHPRFLWRNRLRMADKVVFELLVDATDMSRSFPVHRLVWHDEAIRRSVGVLVRAPSLKTLLQGLLTRQLLDLLIKETEQ